MIIHISVRNYHGLMFKYEALEAERDDFSKTKNQLGSKFLVDLLKDRLSDQDKLKIEKEYSHFFEALKEISDINDIINWQETSELKGAKKFFSHINILPNMPPMQSILSSVRLGYSEEELSMQGLGYRNLVLLFVLINSLLGKETDIALDVLTIEEPEHAKWVLCKKSKDTKNIKDGRQIIKNAIVKYCGAICIDEVQDIDKHMQEIIEELSGMEIPMILMGDPKQDLKGFKCLRNLMSIYEQNVRYISECHRCPQLHLELSNRLVDKNEKQKSEKDSGQLSVYYESEIDCHTLIERQKYDLMYISQKQGVYETHDYKKNNIRENLAEELEPLLFENHPTKDAQTVKKVAYYYAGKMIEKYRSTREKKDAMTLLSNWEKIDSRRYGIIINLFEDESPIKQEDKIFVKSIDYIKGMEGEKCLFILTNDLAAHLFNNNTETNKTKNKLYVALTRSLNELSIYILKEVEDKYTKKRIQDFFERYL